MVNISPSERIESLKAGSIAAIAVGFAYTITVLVNILVLKTTDIEIINLLLRFSGAIASGFLFGVTYRYIVRNDSNSHLSDGAVLAFSLVRSFALLELSEDMWANLYLLSVLGIESIFCFATARVTLDLALNRKWVKPFN